MLECASLEMAKRTLVRVEFGVLGAADVAPDGQAREVADRAARDEGAAGRSRAGPRCRREGQGLVLGDDDATGLQPTRAVESRTRHHHVKEQRVLRGRVGDEGQEAR